MMDCDCRAILMIRASDDCIESYGMCILDLLSNSVFIITATNPKSDGNYYTNKISR